MTSIKKFKSLKEAQSEAKSRLADFHSLDTPDDLKPDMVASEYVLRVDGDTDVYRMNREGKIVHHRVAGWITRGMCVSPSDMPCIVS